jgi:proline iminopeptidase
MTTPLKEFFPEIEPYSTGFLDVSHGHQLYWEQSGNPDGVPVVFLHGGPGGGTSPQHRRFFDPAFYRIILFDQRGSGKSTPHASVENNTRALLVGDIETMRAHLKINTWHVFGGSWGSTLALSYAIAHSQKCISLMLRGIFLLEQDELDWFYYNLRHIYPDEWEKFVSIIPEAERGDLVNAYAKRLNSTNKDEQYTAAVAWAQYESHCSNLIPKLDLLTTESQKAFALAIARIESHYFTNEVIPPEHSMLKSIDRIRHIPATIIHGRYDVICPIQAGYKLHKAWPEATFITVPTGGHSAFDPPVRSELILATERAKTISYSL